MGKIDPIAMYAPGASEAEGELRRRIHRAQGAAHARACDFRSLDAGHLSHIASGIASVWVFKRDARRDDLEEVVKILTWLFLAGAALERLEAADGE
jgi:hypothetical protein